MSVTAFTPVELAERCKNGRKIDLIDVRTPMAFQEVHLQFARNVPLDKLDPAALMNGRESPVRVRDLQSNEEAIIARRTCDLLRA
jgi:hypothetical protein